MKRQDVVSIRLAILPMLNTILSVIFKRNTLQNSYGYSVYTISYFSKNIVLYACVVHAQWSLQGSRTALFIYE